MVMSVINIKIVAIKRKHTFSFFFFPNLCLYVDSQICGNALRFLWVEEIKELQKFSLATKAVLENNTYNIHCIHVYEIYNEKQINV